MNEPQNAKRYRCRYCGYVFNAWLPAAKHPNGALLLGHLGQMHPIELRPLLERMRTEDIATVAAEAYEVAEEGGTQGRLRPRSGAVRILGFFRLEKRIRKCHM